MASSVKEKKFSLISNNKGQIAGTGFVLMMIGLLTGVGLILDTGKLFETRMKVQTSIDGSLLACGDYFYRKGKQLTSQEVTDCLKKNFEFNLELNDLDAENCSEKDFSSAPGEKNRYVYSPADPPNIGGYMEINCSMRHDTVLLGLLPGVNILGATSGTSNTGQYSTGGNIPVAVVLTLDLSNSINQTELDEILGAAIGSLKALPTNSIIAINTFNGGYNGNWGSFAVNNSVSKNVWIRNIVGWDNGEVWLRLNGPEAVALATNRIQSFSTKYWSSNGTYGQGGLYMARMLLDDLDGWFGGKGIIFLSDGEMTVSASPRSYVYPPKGGALCAENDSTCKQQYLTNLDPDDFKSPTNISNSNSWRIVENGNSYPNRTLPLVDDTWYKRNLYTQYDEKEILDGVSNPQVRIWPVNEAYLPNLTLNYFPNCGISSSVGSVRSGNALAAEQADLARRAGIEVYTICYPCRNETKPNEIVMKRIGADKDLPQNWLSLIGTNAGAGNWMLEHDGTTNCSGYGQSDGKAYSGYYANRTETTFDYSKDIDPSKQRFYFATSSTTEADYTDIITGIFVDLQKGNLIK